MTTAEAPPKPRKLNRLLLERQEVAWVNDQIPAEGPEGVWFAAAAPLVTAAERAAARDRPKRDAAALSLSFYDGVRALHDVIGVSRAYFHTMRSKALRLTEEEKAGKWLANATPADIAARAEACGIKRIPIDTAIRTAERLGERTYRQEQRATAGRVVRDPMIVRLYRQGRTRGELAEIASLDESRISQIVGDSA